VRLLADVQDLSGGGLAKEVDQIGVAQSCSIADMLLVRRNLIAVASHLVSAPTCFVDLPEQLWGAFTRHAIKTLISEQLIDYVRAAVTHAGGITSAKKLMDFVALYQIKSGFHGPTDISPVGQAAALHLDIAIHNFGIQEYMKHSVETLGVFRTSYTFQDGLLHPGMQPGLGVEYDEKAGANYPYSPAYLPVSRLQIDGTMHDW
jgi:hypothetical protein